MDRERIDPGAERSRVAARADIEALRTSDQLQRIFRSDRAATDRVGRGDAGTPPLGELLPRGGGFFSRRARVLVGLVPVYLATAVLAVEGLKALRHEPERLAYLSAGDLPRGTAEAEPANALPARAAPTDKPEPDKAEPDKAERAVDASPAGSGSSAAENEEGREGQAVRLTATPDRSVRPAARQADAPARQRASVDKASIDVAKAAASPASPVGGPAPRRAHSASGATAQAIGGATIATEDAGRLARVPGEDRQQRRPMAADPSSAAADTVPQATWTSREPPPVPAPAPRFARLSQVLAQGGTADRTLTEPAARGLETRSAPPRIVVHYRKEAGAAAAERLASELRARGFARTELRPVSFGISGANVRYFHTGTRRVARAVNEMVQGTGYRSDVRDFTHYSPSPSVGTVEVWLPG